MFNEENRLQLREFPVYQIRLSEGRGKNLTQWEMSGRHRKLLDDLFKVGPMLNFDECGPYRQANLWELHHVLWSSLKISTGSTGCWPHQRFVQKTHCLVDFFWGFPPIQQPIGRLIRNSIPNRPFCCSWKEHIVHTSKVHGTLIVYQKRSFFGSKKLVPHIWSPLKLRRKSAIWVEAGKSCFEAETSTKGVSCSLDKIGCGS